MYLSKQKLHMDTRKRISSLSGCSAIWKTDKDLEGSWCTEGKAKCKEEEESSGQTGMGVCVESKGQRTSSGKHRGEVESPQRIPLLASMYPTFSPESHGQGVIERKAVRKKQVWSQTWTPGSTPPGPASWPKADTAWPPHSMGRRATWYKRTPGA